MLHGTSVDPAVGFEVEAAWGISQCVTVGLFVTSTGEPPDVVG